MVQVNKLTQYYRCLEWKSRLTQETFHCPTCNTQLFEVALRAVVPALSCKVCCSDIDLEKLSEQAHCQLPDWIQLYRPVGEAEWQKIKASGSRAFPPRFSWQPIFYPVLSYRYACEIAKNWNTLDEASQFTGHVTRFEVSKSFLGQFHPRCVGAAYQTEYWIPSERLSELNDHLRGEIELVKTYVSQS